MALYLHGPHTPAVMLRHSFFLASIVYIFCHVVGLLMPIPVSERSKGRVCGRTIAGIAVSNPAEGTDICFILNAVCCQVERYF